MRVGVPILLLLLLSAVGHARRVNLRNDVKVLTFSRGEWTKGRRSSPIRQLQCVGGAARNQFQPDAIQCTNVGWDGTDVQWKCEASLPSNFRLGKTIVSCEGYDYPEDDFILAGSCGLEYTLEYEPGQRSSRSTNFRSYDDSEGFFTLILKWGIISLMCFFFYKVCCSGRSRSSGGDDGGDYHRPGDPPPYSSNPSGFAPGCAPSFYSQAPPASSYSGPGFFSGIGLGSALGYMFSNRNQPRQQAAQGYNDYSSSFRGGGARATSDSNDSHTSTSYGTTRRR